MAVPQTMTTVRIFMIHNFEEEEKYLRKMSLKGWHFNKFNLIVYHFEKGEPIDYYYRLDYKQSLSENVPEYFQMFRDDNWEHIQQFPALGGAWQYFRKQSIDGVEQFIYTDNDSKIDLLKRIRRRWSFFGFGLVFIVNFLLLFNTINIFNIDYRLGLIVVISHIFILILYSYFFIQLSLKINKLK